jgi:type IV pilus assembly protein PilB
VVPDRMGKLLLEARLISEKQLEEALQTQKKAGGRLGSLLVKMGAIKEDKLLQFLSQQYGVPPVDLASCQIEASLNKLIPLEVVKKYVVVPVKRVGSTLTLAMVDPSNVFAIDDIKFLTGYHVEPLVALETAIMDSVRRLYGGGGGGGSAKPADPDSEQHDTAATAAILQAKDYTLSEEDLQGDDLDIKDSGPMVAVEDFDTVVGDVLSNIDVVEEVGDEQTGATGEVEAPIVKLVNGILVNAVKVGASDIHLEPYETLVRVRFRLDGELHPIMNLPLKVRNTTVSRIKIMAKLDIAERRLPQDGRIKLKLGKKRDIDFRVSVLPCLYGEKVVMRILDKGNIQLDMTKLGFEERALSDFQEALAKPYGMILVTGPTGSGKTTTLYSALQLLNTPDVNIMTAEDPVEFNFTGINQVQMKDEIGLNFATSLRSFLRQDPDIIMVGEIRDYETAEIAVKAALTGHLVLSTLHTNDAPSTINRLLNMGIEPFLVSSSVVLIMAQRLARRICKSCIEPDKIAVERLIGLGFSPEEAKHITPMKGKGCQACNQTGYKGRVALYEVMPIKEDIRELILQGASADDIKKCAIRAGFKTLRMSGLTKIAEGVTTVEEVGGVTFAD